MTQIITIAIVGLFIVITIGRLWLEYKRYDRRRADLNKNKDKVSETFKKYQAARERRPDINQMKEALYRLKAEELDRRLRDTEL